MKLNKLNLHIEYVDKPLWSDDFKTMGKEVENILNDQHKKGRFIQRIIIEVDKPTKIEYYIEPGRWIKNVL